MRYIPHVVVDDDDDDDWDYCNYNDIGECVQLVAVVFVVVPRGTGGAGTIKYIYVYVCLVADQLFYVYKPYTINSTNCGVYNTSSSSGRALARSLARSPAAVSWFRKLVFIGGVAAAYWCAPPLLHNAAAAAVESWSDRPRILLRARERERDYYPRSGVAGKYLCRPVWYIPSYVFEPVR